MIFEKWLGSQSSTPVPHVFISIFLILVTSRGICHSHLTSFDLVMVDLARCKAVSPDVLIWVQGRATSVHQRSMIRETFGNAKRWPGKVNVMVVFFMGNLKGKDAALQSLLEYEFEHYRDIVQANFIEDYKNQTYKMMTAINYISDHCYIPRLILRIDDDIVFHPAFFLNKLIYTMSNHTVNESLVTLDEVPSNTVACRLIDDFGIWRIKDHPKHFNAVGDDVLPGEEWYPPFCAGFFVAMSGDVPRLLQPHIATNKPFWMDDRYMGVLQKHAGVTNISITEMLDFGYSSVTRENLEHLTAGETIARHLPTNLKKHLLQIYQYLELFSHGLLAHFETIKYRK